MRITVIATGFDRQQVQQVQHKGPSRPSGRERSAGGSQIALPYDSGSVVTREYPPPQARAARPSAVPVANSRRLRHDSDDDVPIHEASEVEHALAELSREPYAEMTIEANRADGHAVANRRHLAHGSGPLPYEASGQIVVGAAPPPQNPTAGDRRRPEFPKVHPSLRQVLADVEVDSELDVPTFLRRASE